MNVCMHVYVCMSVCVYIYVCMHTCTHACIVYVYGMCSPVYRGACPCVHIETRGVCPVSCFVILCIISLSQSLSLTQDLGWVH